MLSWWETKAEPRESEQSPKPCHCLAAGKATTLSRSRRSHDIVSQRGQTCWNRASWEGAVGTMVVPAFDSLTIITQTPRRLHRPGQIAEITTMPRCRAITMRGKRCTFDATERRLTLCWIHRVAPVGRDGEPPPPGNQDERDVADDLRQYFSNGADPAMDENAEKFAWGLVSAGTRASGRFKSTVDEAKKLQSSLSSQRPDRLIEAVGKLAIRQAETEAHLKELAIRHVELLSLTRFLSVFCHAVDEEVITISRAISNAYSTRNDRARFEESMKAAARKIEERSRGDSILSTYFPREWEWWREPDR
ncbi:hypothetical protein DM02DRAFT_364782 [Periconia macrospinosa]|uniref:Uncharacterized protein n=1 Tax=Periconia macrospinosa TaxID=97972 RepID=A0A2V1DSH9_9PLEO|nr:hypothetical protein DM02DRAFT_364782 [Periconia macrospinosa]